MDLVKGSAYGLAAGAYGIVKGAYEVVAKALNPLTRLKELAEKLDTFKDQFARPTTDLQQCSQSLSEELQIIVQKEEFRSSEESVKLIKNLLAEWEKKADARKMFSATSECDRSATSSCEEFMARIKKLMREWAFNSRRRATSAASNSRPPSSVSRPATSIFNKPVPKPKPNYPTVPTPMFSHLNLSKPSVSESNSKPTSSSSQSESSKPSVPASTSKTTSSSSQSESSNVSVPDSKSKNILKSPTLPEPKSRKSSVKS